MYVKLLGEPTFKGGLVFRKESAGRYKQLFY